MKINELIKIHYAPHSGQMLAYTRKAVLFEKYESIDSVQEKLSGMELLELHLFSKEKEYRAISTESKSFADGIIEYISDFDETQNDNVYKEECIVTGSEETIIILNHIFYDEGNGMALIDDYRLMMGGK